MPLNRLGISWQINDYTSSGLTALQVSLNLIAAGGMRPLLYAMPRMISPPPGAFEKLRPYVDEMQILLDQLDASKKTATLGQVLAVHGLFENMLWEEISTKLLGRSNVGMSFCRELPATLDAAKRARALDRVIVRSRWHEDGLRAMGLENIVYWRPGYDDWLLYPRDKEGGTDNWFTVYSAGPLSLSNAQDTVIAAFRAFREKHPDARLVTSWHSPFVREIPTLEFSPHGVNAPGTAENNTTDIVGWLVRNGIPQEAVTDSGIIGAQSRPTYLGQADIALFPNRCNGGPNLYAMEALAMGIPCILSANTGHLDLIEHDNVLKLEKQEPVKASPSSPVTDWRESDVDEIVAHLEWAYEHRDELKGLGLRGADSVKPFTWANQTSDLLDKLSDLIAVD